MYAPINHYQNMQVTTASPEKILLMLCDGAVSFSRIARERMSRNDVAGKGTYIGKALAIVTELRGTLNHEAGGEIAGNLERLYTYIIDQFIDANVNNDPNSLENAIKILSHVRDSWTEAVEVARKERAEQGEQRVRVAG